MLEQGTTTLQVIVDELESIPTQCFSEVQRQTLTRAIACIRENVQLRFALTVGTTVVNDVPASEETVMEGTIAGWRQDLSWLGSESPSSVSSA